MCSVGESHTFRNSLFDLNFLVLNHVLLALHNFLYTISGLEGDKAKVSTAISARVYHDLHLRHRQTDRRTHTHTHMSQHTYTALSYHHGCTIYHDLYNICITIYAFSYTQHATQHATQHTEHNTPHRHTDANEHDQYQRIHGAEWRV